LEVTELYEAVHGAFVLANRACVQALLLLVGNVKLGGAGVGGSTPSLATTLNTCFINTLETHCFSCLAPVLFG
jgi:hypothetical protein